MKNAIVQLGALTVALAGYVVLSVTGEATTEYMTLVTPILAALYLKEHLTRQDQTLGAIQENTNGVLDKRIKDAVQEVLDSRSV